MSQIEQGYDLEVFVRAKARLAAADAAMSLYGRALGGERGHPRGTNEEIMRAYRVAKKYHPHIRPPVFRETPPQ